MKVTKDLNKKLIRYAFSLDPNNYKDIVQEVLLKFHKYGHNFDGDNLNAYLFKATFNEFLDTKRRNSRNKTIPLSSFHNLIAIPEKEQSKYNLQADQVCKAALKGQELKVMLLRLQDFKYEEIADILEIKIGTVRSVIHRSKDKIRKYLKVK